MSTSTKRSVVWLESEKKGWRSQRASRASRASRISKSASTPVSPSFVSPTFPSVVPLSPLSTRLLIAPSPSPWIDLRSIASSEKSDVESESLKSENISNIDSVSVYSAIEPWELAAGYEKGGFPISYYETYAPRSERGSKRFSAVSKVELPVKSLETEIVYPSGSRFILICISLALSTLPTALDRTIISTAM
jgi:hypothetical protein